MLNYQLRIDSTSNPSDPTHGLTGAIYGCEGGPGATFEVYARDEEHAWWKAAEFYGFGEEFKAPESEMTDERRSQLLHAIVRQLGPGCFTWTAAPDRYDGFGTMTVEITKYKNNRHETFRKVWTPAPHITWQRMRYSSGVYGAWDTKQWADEVLYMERRDAELKREALGNAARLMEVMLEKDETLSLTQ